MAFLTINGIEVEVAEATMEPIRIGERSRAFSGKARKSTRAQKKEWSLTTVPLEPIQATALAGLIEGDGHHFAFDTDLYSERGIGPLAGHNGTPTAGGGKFGAGRLVVSAAGSITFPVQLPSTWTVMVYRYEGTWAHYVINSSGQKWRNGVRNDALVSAWLTVSPEGDVTLTNTTASDFDDLVTLPFLTPTSWPATWAAAALPFSALPYLAAGGDMTGPATVMGEVGSSVIVPFSGSTGWVSGQQLDLTLAEV